MFAENLDSFLADFGVPCSAAGHAFAGVLDSPDEALGMAGNSVVSAMATCTVKTSDVQAAQLRAGAALTVDGQPYVVREVLRLDDGAFSRLALSR